MTSSHHKHQCVECSFVYDEEKRPLLFKSRSKYGTDSDSSLTQEGAHCHDEENGKETGIDKKARRKLIIASILCLAFMTAEIVGGFLANSLAIATDAAHLLTDFASFMISLFSIYLASRKATKKMSFGWHRAEVMGAVISVLLIWVVTGILVYMAVERVMQGEFEIDATIMLITSGMGVLVNIIMGCTLHDTHGHSHGGGGHSHGGSHGNHGSEDEHRVDMDTENKHLIKSNETTNINVRAAFIHVIGDFIQSLGVFIAALIIFFKPEWKLADPICTFVFSLLVLFTTISILRDALNVLMEATPRGIEFKEVWSSLKDIPGVTAIHNLRIWSLTTNKIAMSVHLALAPGSNGAEILAEAGRLMRVQFSIYECTIQIEKYVDDMKDCKDCQSPRD